MRSFELNTTNKSKPVVYVDMDGVLADMFGEIAKKHGVDYWREIHRQELGVDQIAQKKGFFKNLPPLPNAAHLLAGIIIQAGEYSILSSPLLSEVDRSSEEKAEWLSEHVPGHPPKAIIFDHEKYKYAKQANGTPNILIDDWDTNIRLWEANGGIGILYKDSKCTEALAQLRLALQGDLEPEVMEPYNNHPDSTQDKSRLYTSRQVLKYVNGIHKEYHMPKPILAHTTWILKDVPLSSLQTPEHVHQDDPYRRVIDINWDHVKDIDLQDILDRPVVADENGWILDGNHRVTAARARGMDTVPALVPYTTDNK